MLSVRMISGISYTVNANTESYLPVSIPLRLFFATKCIFAFAFVARNSFGNHMFGHRNPLFPIKCSPTKNIYRISTFSRRRVCVHWGTFPGRSLCKSALHCEAVFERTQMNEWRLRYTHNMDVIYRKFILMAAFGD